MIFKTYLDLYDVFDEKVEPTLEEVVQFYEETGLRLTRIKKPIEKLIKKNKVVTVYLPAHGRMTASEICNKKGKIRKDRFLLIDNEAKYVIKGNMREYLKKLKGNKIQF